MSQNSIMFSPSDDGTIVMTQPFSGGGSSTTIQPTQLNQTQMSQAIMHPMVPSKTMTIVCPLSMTMPVCPATSVSVHPMVNVGQGPALTCPQAKVITISRSDLRPVTPDMRMKSILPPVLRPMTPATNVQPVMKQPVSATVSKPPDASPISKPSVPFNINNVPVQPDGIPLHAPLTYIPPEIPVENDQTSGITTSPFTAGNPLIKPKGMKHQMSLVDAVKKMKHKKRNTQEDRAPPGAVKSAIQCLESAESISSQNKCLSIDSLLEDASELMDEDLQLQYKGQFDDAYDSVEEIIASMPPRSTPAKQMRGISDGSCMILLV